MYFVGNSLLRVENGEGGNELHVRCTLGAREIGYKIKLSFRVPT